MYADHSDTVFLKQFVDEFDGREVGMTRTAVREPEIEQHISPAKFVQAPSVGVEPGNSIQFGS